MKFILYRLLLNLKWFCGNIFRCLTAAILVVLPYTIPTIYPVVKISGLDNFPTYMLPFLGGMTLVLTVLLRLMGFLFKKIHPPLTWKDSYGKVPLLTLNILLCLPFIGLIRTFISNNSLPVDFFVWTELSAVSIMVLFLLNRKESNEDRELANSQPPKLTAENMTPKQLRGMRIAALLQAGLTITFMVLYFRTTFKLDDAERELQIQQYESADIKEHLQLKIDSLTSELSRLKQDTIPNKR
jgi:hypothetical protein